MTRPPIAATMGDPAGIGPEIIAKVCSAPDFQSGERSTIVIGDAKILARASRTVGADLSINEVADPEAAEFRAGGVDVISPTGLPDDLPFGELDARAGAAAFEYLRLAIELAVAGRLEAIVTAPLNKEALHLAGHRYPGHTEILAELTGTRDYAMMLVADTLKVIHVSTHVSLREAIERARPERELTVIRLASDALRRMGEAQPKIAVAGLNPHAGENGLFGSEDAKFIAPAVAAAREEGIDVSGPWPPDTVFMRAARGDFDMVVVQYHDQGHIPIKLAGFDTGVNVTVGLPFFRTSVDHGTAFDIAGTGAADPTSLGAAIDLARELSRPGS